MRLRRDMINRIAGRIASTLLKENLVAGAEASVLSASIGMAITEDLAVEGRLDDEVREILSQHAQEMDRTNVEHHEMFKKIKAKLVRDRKLIL